MSFSNDIIPVHRDHGYKTLAVSRRIYRPGTESNIFTIVYLFVRKHSSNSISDPRTEYYRMFDLGVNLRIFTHDTSSSCQCDPACLHLMSVFPLEVVNVQTGVALYKIRPLSSTWPTGRAGDGEVSDQVKGRRSPMLTLIAIWHGHAGHLTAWHWPPVTSMTVLCQLIHEVTCFRVTLRVPGHIASAGSIGIHKIIFPCMQLTGCIGAQKNYKHVVKLNLHLTFNVSSKMYF